MMNRIGHRPIMNQLSLLLYPCSFLVWLWLRRAIAHPIRKWPSITGAATMIQNHVGMVFSVMPVGVCRGFDS